MKIRKWFIDSKKVFGKIVLEAHGPDFPDGARVEVIDVTGMPTKEELGKAMGQIQRTCLTPATDKLLAWLVELIE